jgi:diguanylate cyclase
MALALFGSASPETVAAACASAQTPDPGHGQAFKFSRLPGGRTGFRHHHGANGRMTTGALNGREHAAAGALPDEQSLLNTARGAANAASDPAQEGGALAPPGAAVLRRAPAINEQELEAALRLIDGLRRQESLLKQKVARLRQAVAQARQFAYHDELTGLPNRRLLMDRFNQAIARAARQHRLVALLFLDLDGFKAINDALGHVAGDSLLKQVAARLSACVRTSDTACRFGGDEFVILLPELESRESAAAAAGKIRAHLAVPYFIGGTEIGVAASIGMALYPVDGKAYEDLLKRSDVAMYWDKARGPAKPSLRCVAVARS